MDIFQIISVHNRKWSSREIIVFVIALIAFSIILWYFMKRKKIVLSQAAASMVLFVYLAFIFASTVFTRMPGQRQYNLVPFWSWYEVIVDRDRDLLIQILLNCVMLFPMGVLLPFVLHRRVKKVRTFLYGFLLAFVIELCQLILCRGYFEWDDMIHNGLGCMLGCIVSQWVMQLAGRKYDKIL